MINYCECEKNEEQYKSYGGWMCCSNCFKTMREKPKK